MKFEPDNMPEFLSKKYIYNNSKIIAGINEDDCAIIKIGESIVVITTDYFNSKPIVLELNLGGFWDIGRLVVAANLSDLCGTGAFPEALMVAVTLERGLDTEKFVEFMDGVYYEASKANVPIVGGDTKLGNANAFLCTAIGSAKSMKNLFLKNKASCGDIIWASGNLGSNTAAVVGIRNKIGNEEWQEWAKKSIIEPDLPLEKSKQVSFLELGKSGIDISDGLGADLKRLCQASNVGAEIYPEKIPTEKELALVASHENLPVWSFAFGVGGDFQFIVTTDDNDEVISKLNSLGLTQIGKITSSRDLTLAYNNGNRQKMPDNGHRDDRNLSFFDEIRYFMSLILSES